MTDAIKRLPISTEDVLRLRAAVQDRDRNLRLDLDHTDEGEDFVSVEVKGRVYGPTRTEPIVVATILRGEQGWLVHHPKDGPLYEFRAIAEVANLLAFGDAKCCRRSWMRAPWRAPAETPKWVSGVGR